VVKRALVGGIESGDGFGDFVVGVGDGFEYALRRYFDWSASRSSRASCSPVEAPEGTAARPKRSAIKNDVGFDSGIAAESMTWRARTLTILVDMMVCSPEWMRINDFTEECHGVTEAWRNELNSGIWPEGAIYADSGSSIRDSWRTTMTMPESVT